ncbi:MAG: hypothetical protein HC830_13305 [Bacteroidetes bacterium]|nr:hypothetical protein [Bacteroidales bacterium]NJO70117.1 hypothetical protein [Bacteroidota bacterium]
MQNDTKTKDRVRSNTNWRQNIKIDYLTRDNIKKYSNQSKNKISKRIQHLDTKWDMERTLEINMATLALSGLALSVFVNKRWAILPGVVLGFFVQHAIQGWCPPLPVFRAMKVRTRTEIDEEKYALKAIRGDFKNIKTPDEALIAVKKI